MKTVYLDHAATTPVVSEVRAEFLRFLDTDWANPSARYPQGVRAAEALDRARSRVARAVGAASQDVVFTSGGTEANNLAVLGVARATRQRAPERNRILVGPSEHPSVRRPAEALAQEGFEVEFAPLDARGDLDLDATMDQVDERTALVAQMLVSNEFGTIYPVPELARRLVRHAPGVHLHVDAVQACGKLELDLDELGAHSLSLSAHKLNAPKGAGALVLRGRVDMAPLLHGGGQEAGRRSGTENVPGIAAFARAVELAEDGRQARDARWKLLRSTLLEGLGGSVRCVAAEARHVPSILSLELPPPPAEVWQHHLEARGVLTSLGSACQARSAELSPSLTALGLDVGRARQVLRISMGADTDADDITQTLAAFDAVARDLAKVVR